MTTGMDFAIAPVRRAANTSPGIGGPHIGGPHIDGPHIDGRGADGPHAHGRAAEPACEWAVLWIHERRGVEVAQRLARFGHRSHAEAFLADLLGPAGAGGRMSIPPECRR